MNRDETIKDLVSRWINKAENDLLTSERELSFEDPITQTICFHCQQAAEKYLKAFLVHHQLYFPKTHKIMELLELCANVDSSFREKLQDADNLTDYAVEIRYPDLSLNPTVQEAKEALETSRKVKDFVLEKLKG